MLRFLWIALVAFSYSASARDDQFSTKSRILTDLKRLDSLDCDIELREGGAIRILSTDLNGNPGRYFDLYLDINSSSLKSFSLIENGRDWTLYREVRLADTMIGTKFGPDFIYGNRITRLETKSDRDDGSLTLVVYDRVNQMGLQSRVTRFECREIKDVNASKGGRCPHCLSHTGIEDSREMSR